MGNTVSTIFTADDKQIQAALARQAKSIVMLEDRLRSYQQQAKKSGDGAKDAADSAVAGFGRAAGAVGIATVAASKLIGAYQDQIALMDTLGKKAGETQKKISGVLLGSGDLANSQYIKQQLGSLRTTRSDATQIFQSVTQANPQMQLADRIALVREASGLAGAGHVEHAAGIGNLAANFIGVDGKNANDATDLAQRLTELAGEDVGTLSDDSYKRGAAILRDKLGVSLEGSLALGLTAKQNDLSPKIVEQLAAQVADEGLKHRQGDAAYNRFVDANSQQRFEMLMAGGDESSAVMGQAAANRLGQIKMSDVNRMAASLGAAQTSDLGSRRAAELMRSSPQAYMEYQAQVEAERSSDDLARRGFERQRRDEALQTYMNQNNYSGAGRLFTNTMVGASQFLGDAAEYFGGEEETQETVLKGAGYDEGEIGKILQENNRILSQMLYEQRARAGESPTVVTNPEAGR